METIAKLKITPNKIYDMPIKDAIEKYLDIGKVLDAHRIGCTKCKVGICKLKDVVKIHFLPDEQEKIIFNEINKILIKEVN